MMALQMMDDLLIGSCDDHEFTHARGQRTSTRAGPSTLVEDHFRSSTPDRQGQRSFQMIDAGGNATLIGESRSESMSISLRTFTSTWSWCAGSTRRRWPCSAR